MPRPIGPQRVKTVPDPTSERIAALHAATDSVQGHAFPISEDAFRRIIVERADFFLDWIRREQDDEPRTFGIETES